MRNKIDGVTLNFDDKLNSANQDMDEAMTSLEAMLGQNDKKFLLSDKPTIADVQIACYSYDLILHGYSWEPYPKAAE